MTPHEFLQQQIENVELALAETLRYEYGPRPIGSYYRECLSRLNLIKEDAKTTDKSDFSGIETRLGELNYLSKWISLIERSRLGEFSWPFAEALREMAESLLVEPPGLYGNLTPIVHIIADGEGYLIHYEKTSVSGKHKFAFINFPRPLKHHVLLHSLFGHELGHTALHTAGIGSAGQLLQTSVIPALASSGPLQNVNTLNSWIITLAAPAEVRIVLAKYKATYGRPFALPDHYYLKWIDEFICDLFGLLLFGPGFVAAHKVFLQPTHANPYEPGLSHPPYAARHKMLVRALRLLKWDKAVAAEPEAAAAEQELLNYVLLDGFDAWADVLSDQQIRRAILGIQSVLSSHGSLGYVPPDGRALSELVQQLGRRLPPIIAHISNRGLPLLKKTSIAHTLYAGWIYVLGSTKLTSEPLNFLNVNMLCDHALLQQRAINIALDRDLK